MAADAALAAVSGSFSFISDDPSYQPDEPRLDFCCRAGEVVSLPTATKPALLVRDGRPVIETLNATGTLTLGGHPYRWVGSKTAHHGAGHRPGTLVVFGAANCRVGYSENPRTGFLRHVDPDANTTPPDPSAVDYVVAHTPNDTHRVVAVHPGGGADLFAGNFVLRAAHPWDTRLERGAPVEITRIAGHDPRHLESGISLGPSVADAATGHTAAYDDGCLGTSPFRDTRHARTLVGLHGRELTLQVLDGAPKSDTFRGTTPTRPPRSARPRDSTRMPCTTSTAGHRPRSPTSTTTRRGWSAACTTSNGQPNRGNPSAGGAWTAASCAAPSC